MRPANSLKRFASFALLAVLSGSTADAQTGQPMPGSGTTISRYDREFPGLLYGSDSGWVTVYATTRDGETVDARVAGLHIIGLPDSVRFDKNLVLPVLLRREYQQIGSTSPRVMSTTWRYAPEIKFERFMTTVLVETAGAPDGDIEVYVDGEKMGMYSNRARYSRVALPFWMERPYAQLRVTANGKALWEGRFVTVPDRRTRLEFVEGGVQFVSP